MAQHGYAAGDPFGDPSQFSRSTGEDEIARYNDWMRSQPWWQQIRGSGTGDVTPAQEQQIAQAAQAQGITVPKDFHIDQGGNFNQKSRTKRNLILAGLAGAAALTGGAALGAFGGVGAAGAGGAAAGGAGAAGAGAGAGTLASTAIGSGFMPAIAGGTGLGALGGGAAAAGVGAGTLASTTLGSGMAAPIAGGTGISSATGGGGVLSTLGTIGRNGQRLTDLGNTLSQGAGALSYGRRADSNADLVAANSNNRARLDAAEFNIGAPVTRAQQVAKGDLMSADIPQSKATGSGRDISFSGGIGPQSFGANTTQAGNELKRQALLALMTKSDQLDPQITQPRKAGVGENVMAGAGLTSNILGTLGRFGGR